MQDLSLFGHPVGTAAAVVAGLALVLAGRRLFWLAVGLAGFAAGLLAAIHWLRLEPWWLEVLLAVLAGVVGALAATFLQRLVVALVGFFAGGWLALEVWRLAGQQGGGFAWLVFLVGGIAAALLAVLLFEVALAAATSLLGAELIVEAAAVDRPTGLVLVVVIATAGLLIQLAFGRRRGARG